MKYKFDQLPTKVHFSKPEAMYVHPESGAELPFRTGARYWVPWGGPSGKGTYLEPGEEDVIAAYKNPAEFGLDIAPIAKYQKLHPKIYYAVSGYVEEWFHLVQKTNKNTGNTFRERERCVGRECEHCKERVPKVFGKKVYFEIARTHWNESIFSINEQVGANCRCGQGNAFIYTPHYECSNCGEMLVDFMHRCFSCQGENVGIDADNAQFVCQDCQSEWSVYESDNPEISKLVNGAMKCNNCGHDGLPKPILVCTDCESPDPYGVFDCQMKIQMVGSKDGKSKEMRIDNVLVQEPDPRLFDPKFQGDEEEWANKAAEGMSKPIDLDKLLAPSSADDQARQLKVQNPFNLQGGGQGYRNWGHNQDEQSDQGDSQQQPDETPEEEGSVVNRPPKGRRLGRPAVNK